MDNERNQTANEILKDFTEEMHTKVGLFVSTYGFYPVRPGTESFEKLPLTKRKYSFAFFSHTQIVMLEDRIHDWSEQVSLLRSVGK